MNAHPIEARENLQWSGRIVTRAAWLGIRILGCFIAGHQQTSAQPIVTVQPRNAAVALGQDAQFTVTAPTTVPVTYQWRLDGRELAGATNASLTIANVALSNLGRYDVVVRDSVGAVTSDPAWLLFARWTELVVFGASGELPRCGDLAWPSYLANRLGVRLRNYAVGASDSSRVQTQVTGYLSGNIPATNTLIGLWTGGVDLYYRPLSAEQAVANHFAHVRRLANAGARNFLIPTLWPPEMVPAFASRGYLTSELVVKYDALLGERLKALQAEYALTIYRSDMFHFLTAIWEDPATYGFNVPLGTDFTCDDLHFTTEVHRLLSEELYHGLMPPLRIDSTVRTADGNIVLNWSGGAPPFRIERTSDPLSAQWEAVGGPTFLPSATINPARPQEFFRVQSLGQ